ncbi:hypothetical protein PAPHI01_1769 [Pancytospora philotis]|nr:hypothetical protein PAPHI01_1769 [Pancytospora philotis]
MAGSLIGNPYFQFFLFLVVAAVCYALYRVMSRMSSVRDLPRNPRGFSFKGVVTSVSDGDGFRVFHVPWMRNKAYSRSSPKLPVRLAGIDAPEMRFFGTPAQPFSKEAKELLSALALKKTVHVTVYSIDMYSRIVAMVCIKTGWFSWTNVNLEMVRAGLACVYDRAGAEYGGLKAAFEAAQAEAKRKKRGMWSLPSVVLPMDYKSRKR